MTPLAQTHARSAPFDAIADRYDSIFTLSTIGQAQRGPVWRELRKSFRPGDRIFEIGCGTGVDACFLAGHGMRVVACDSSARMLDVARRRVAGSVQRSANGSVELRLLPAEQISKLGGEGLFDGAFSNFGALNCVEDVRRLAVDLASVLKPGANALLCLMNPRCLWEISWYLLQGKLSKAFRRLHRGSVEARLGDGAIVRIQYPSVRFMRRTFAPQFRLTAITGIGVAVPPSYVEPWASRFPGAVRLAMHADSLLGRCPGVRMFADHILLRFERTST
jgi:ubiquinone/menaquinone biosynthesis C-methylase UbiE